MKQSLVIKLIRALRVPIMLILNKLPKGMARKIFLAFSGPNGDTQTVFRSATDYRALEVMYTFPDRRDRGETSVADFFWENFLNNARSIRNRLLLEKQELFAAIKESSERKEEVKIVILGSGSARAILEVMSELNNKPVHVKLIDMSRDAITFSKELSLDFNLDKGQIEWHRAYAQNIERYCRNFHPDIVEMVGMLDYYPQKQAVDLITKIYKVLSPNGWFITCNIHPNIEAPFVSKGINWPMIYREPNELRNILLSGGFEPEHISIIYESLGIHGLAVAQKLV